MKTKKLSLLALLTLSSISMIKAETFEKEFEKLKEKTDIYTKDIIKSLDKRWHDVLKKLKECIDMSEKTNVDSRTVKQLHDVAEKTKKQLIKRVATSAAKKHIKDFQSVAAKADKKDDSHLKKVEHMVSSIHKQLETATTHAAQGKKDSIAAHTGVQKALMIESKNHQVVSKKK